MDRRLLEARAEFFRSRTLPSAPADVEQWHAIRLYDFAFKMPGDLAQRLIQIADDMTRHASYLSQREAQLAARRSGWLRPYGGIEQRGLDELQQSCKPKRL